MSQRRNRTAFQLTLTEIKMLALKRAGMTTREICAALGKKPFGLPSMSWAVEKERLLLLRDLNPERGTSLRRARGNTERTQ